MSEPFKQGYESFKPYLNLLDTNPYKRVDDWKEGQIKTFQPEHLQFYNGWETARQEAQGIKYSLFLDDFRYVEWVSWIAYPAGPSWYMSRHYYDFVETIEEKGLPDLVSFDYDLDLNDIFIKGEKPYKTGLDCAKWLIEYCEKNKLPFPRAAVHSTNIEGSKAIYETVKAYLEKQNGNG
jgi:hypothetical protein